jgi:polar amino acid transport system permease protein
MPYVFQFGAVADHLPELLHGAALTLRLSVLAMLFGLGLGIAGAALTRSRHGAVRFLLAGYVEVIRNTPFLVQIFVIYFSLPAIGIRLGANFAALLGLSVNLGAYATEIIRSGIDAVPAGQTEAGRALGLSRLQIFRLVILRPALRIVYPALVSQFILLMLGSSVVSAISAVELTAITNSLASTTFRSFEFYFVATLLYFLMAFGCRLVLGAAGRVMFGRWPA